MLNIFTDTHWARYWVQPRTALPWILDSLMHLITIDKSLINTQARRKKPKLTRAICHWPWNRNWRSTVRPKGSALPQSHPKEPMGVACVGCYWIFKIYRFLCAHEKRVCACGCVDWEGDSCYLCNALNSQLDSPSRHLAAYRTML